MPNMQNDLNQTVNVPTPRQPTPAQRVAFTVTDVIRAGASIAGWVIVAALAAGAAVIAIVAVFWAIRLVLQALGR